jgi:hypothetical protein
MSRAAIPVRFSCRRSLEWQLLDLVDGQAKMGELRGSG